MCSSVSTKVITTAQVTIEKFWARSRRELGKKRVRTFTNFHKGTVNLRNMGVFISRINIEVYSESVLEIFASFTIITCVSEKYGHFYLAQSEQKKPGCSHCRIWY